MSKFLKKTASLVFIPLIVIFLVFFPSFTSGAATLNNAYLVLSRIQSNLTSSSNLEIYIAFATSGTIPSGATVTLQFPDGDDGGWCRTEGALTVVGVNSTPGDSTGAYDIDATLPGALSATCSKGAGTNSVDTIRISGVAGLNSIAGTYGVKISNGAVGKLGTSATAGQKILSLTVQQGTTVETKSFGVSVVSNDRVTISAEVVNPPTITCSIDSNSINLGNLYRGGMYVTGSHTISVITSDNSSGYWWSAYGKGDSSTNAGLYKSTATTYLIKSDNSSATVDISDPGSEGFGMNVTVPSGEAVAGVGFGDNSAGVFGSLGMGASNAELIAYKNWGPQTTTAQSTITYGARAGAAVPGAYSETVTFVCGGYIGDYGDDPYNWILGFGNIFHSSFEDCDSETNTETLPDDATLYLDIIPSKQNEVVYYRRNSGSIVQWPDNTTVNFSKNDTLSIVVKNADYYGSVSGNIILKIDNSSGRTASEFSYYVSCGPS